MKENINNLILNNRGLAVLIANKIYKEVPDFLREEIDLEDLIQEGFLGLMNAAEAFDPEKGWKFSTYAYPCIQRQIYAFIKKYNYLNLEDLDNYIDEEEETPQEYNNKASEIVFVETHTRNTGDMGPKTKEVVLLCLKGKDTKEISLIMGTKERTVSDKIKIGVKKLRRTYNIIGEKLD